jgi:hypothetical protein
MVAGLVTTQAHAQLDRSLNHTFDASVSRSVNRDLAGGSATLERNVNRSLERQIGGRSFNLNVDRNVSIQRDVDRGIGLGPAAEAGILGARGTLGGAQFDNGLNRSFDASVSRSVNRDVAGGNITVDRNINRNINRQIGGRSFNLNVDRNVSIQRGVDAGLDAGSGIGQRDLGTAAQLDVGISNGQAQQLDRIGNGQAHQLDQNSQAADPLSMTKGMGDFGKDLDALK